MCVAVVAVHSFTQAIKEGNGRADRERTHIHTRLLTVSLSLSLFYTHTHKKRFLPSWFLSGSTAERCRLLLSESVVWPVFFVYTYSQVTTDLYFYFVAPPPHLSTFMLLITKVASVTVTAATATTTIKNIQIYVDICCGSVRACVCVCRHDHDH